MGRTLKEEFDRLPPETQALVEARAAEISAGKRFVVMGGRHPSGVNLVSISDEEFHWDAMLKVHGDFESLEEKLRYAEAIAKVLSEHATEIPFEPAGGRSFLDTPEEDK